MPPTWIVGQEKYFSPGLPNGITNLIDLATLSKSKRAFVLKPSGFSADSSWSEGVHFLHEKSTDKAQALLQHAKQTPNTLFVVQDFQRGSKIPLRYENDNGGTNIIEARIRLTPYFAEDSEEGKLIAIKATACENTNYIHASSTSINMAVAEK